VTLNGYRWDDFTPYVYMSDDYGQSWTSLSDGLPLGAVNVIREDPTHADLLYLGTDDGIYVSMDRGSSWSLFDGGLPKVACHDLVVQETASELVAGTHGRSIYIANLKPIQQYMAHGANGLFVLTPKPVRFSNRWGKSYSDWSAPRMPDFLLEFFSPQQGQGTISLKGSGKQAIWEKSVSVAQGYNNWAYDLTLNPDQLKAFKKATGQVLDYNEGAPIFLPKGTYTLEVSTGGQIRSVPLIIE